MNQTAHTNCLCQQKMHAPKFVVITGGPGAGKTAVLELIRKVVCPHIAILPEAASILFNGGFWRHDTLASKTAVQRAIYHVQTEMERIVAEESKTALALCDRGTIDGLAYWPKDTASFWSEIATTREAQFKKYAAVIHLRTPQDGRGYNNSNPVRIENASQALAIDENLIKVWDGHPNRIIIESADDFLEKANATITAIRTFIPDCCATKKSPSKRAPS